MNLLYVTLASILAGVSIAVPLVWFLSIPTLGFLFYTLWFKVETGKRAFLNGAVFGFATTGAGIWWLWDALPLTWTPVQDPILSWLIVFMTWAYVSLTICIAVGVFAWLVWKLRNNALLPVFTTMGWLLQEIGREWIFYVATYAKQALFGAHFSVSALGYTLTESQYILQLSEKVGIYGLECIIALFAATGALIIYDILHTQKRLRTLIFLIITLFILSIPSLYHYKAPTTEKAMRFALIGAYIPIPWETEPQVIYKEKLEEIANSDIHPDIVIFPEGNGLTKIYPDEDTRKAELQKLFGTGKEVLVISSNYTEDATAQNHSLLYYDSNLHGTIGLYEKMFYMAQGEYSPYVSRVIFKILNNKTINDHMENLGGALVRGSRPVAVPYHGFVFGGLLCSEILSPHLYRDLVTKYDANILVNLSHTAWFGPSHTLFVKEKQMARVHAVQNRKYFIQTSNGFPSFVLNPNGESIAETKEGETTVFTVDIPIPSQ